MKARELPESTSTQADRVFPRTRQTASKVTGQGSPRKPSVGLERSNDSTGIAVGDARSADAAHIIGAKLCEEVIQGFEGRATIGMAGAARILGMHVKTLRVHVEDGNLSFIQRGTGLERPRRVFTPNDLLDFYVRQRRRASARGFDAVRQGLSRRF
jgi:hypothetical protein